MPLRNQTEMNNVETVYVFFVQRPQDKQAWPLVYTDQLLAESCHNRVSEVTTVKVHKIAEPIQLGNRS